MGLDPAGTEEDFRSSKDRRRTAGEVMAATRAADAAGEAGAVPDTGAEAEAQASTDSTTKIRNI